MALLDQAPTLADKVARGKRMTKTRKIVAGVPLRLAHAGSSTALKSDPAALALTDEADELLANVKNQGDPIGLIDRRGETYADFVHAIVSTPSRGPIEVKRDEESGLEFWAEQDLEVVESAIWRLWQQGTRYHWAWPCPHCDEYFIPRFRCLQWPKGATPSEARMSATVGCPRCGSLIENHQKAGMNERGVYVAPGQSVTRDGEVLGEPPLSPTVSFWVSGLASPFRTFGERAAEFLEAVRSGNQAEVQTVLNGGFGELWAPSGGDAPEWADVANKARGSGYLRGVVPDGVRVLTLTADVQTNGIYWLVRGWGPRATSWLVDYGQLLGHTADAEVWEQLGDMVTSPIGGLPIRMAFIDSGFRPGRVDSLPINRVYEFCRRFQHRVRPTKGSSAPMRVPLLTSKIEVTRSGKASRFGLELVRLDTDHWKSWVHERMRWPEGAAGAWYLPANTDEDYCRQVVSEARVKGPGGRPRWVDRHRENHYFDCEAMQGAIGHLLGVQRLAGEIPAPEASTDPDADDVADEVEAPPVRPPPPPPPVVRRQQFQRRVHRSSFMQG
jgi:phage terminase large subunit GpA-like protein